MSPRCGQHGTVTRIPWRSTISAKGGVTHRAAGRVAVSHATSTCANQKPTSRFAGCLAPCSLFCPDHKHRRLALGVHSCEGGLSMLATGQIHTAYVELYSRFEKRRDCARAITGSRPPEHVADHRRAPKRMSRPSAGYLPPTRARDASPRVSSSRTFAWPCMKPTFFEGRFTDPGIRFELLRITCFIRVIARSMP